MIQLQCVFEQELLLMWGSLTVNRRVLCWMTSVHCNCASETSVLRTCQWLGLKMVRQFALASSTLHRAWTSTASTPCLVFSNSLPMRTTRPQSSHAEWCTALRGSLRKGSSYCPTCTWKIAVDSFPHCHQWSDWYWLCHQQPGDVGVWWTGESYPKRILWGASWFSVKENLQ